MARLETTTIAPAMGEEVRPKVPIKKAKAPSLGTSMPNSAAWGVTASLKAKVESITGARHSTQ